MVPSLRILNTCCVAALMPQASPVAGSTLTAVGCPGPLKFKRIVPSSPIRCKVLLPRSATQQAPVFGLTARPDGSENPVILKCNPPFWLKRLTLLSLPRVAPISAIQIAPSLGSTTAGQPGHGCAQGGDAGDWRIERDPGHSIVPSEAVGSGQKGDLNSLSNRANPLKMSLLQKKRAKNGK